MHDLVPAVLRGLCRSMDLRVKDMQVYARFCGTGHGQTLTLEAMVFRKTGVMMYSDML